MNMADSIFSSLLKMIDSRDVRAIAGALGESEHSVSRGMQSSIAAVMASIASKAGDPGALRKTLDIFPSGSGHVTWPDVVETATDPQAPWIDGGKRMLSSLFGSNENRVIDAIGKGSGLRSSAASTLMSVAAPFVLSYIGKRVRDEGMTMSGLGTMLQRDLPAIRNALPAGLGDIIWPARAHAAAASPVVAQEVMVERRPRNWFAPLALAGLALAGFWLLYHARRPSTFQNYPGRTGEASRAAPETGKVAPRRIPDQVKMPDEVKTPMGTASRAKTIDNADLMYQTGSANLLPESRKQLEHLADQLKASPDAHMKVSGYTDDVGDANRNLELSQKRADNVRAYLVREGVASDRVTAKGYGEADPVADNSTVQGRAKNRRVIVIVE
jgi:outer membrane protein OmpA-like peptidoglycan-associated protein